MFTRKCILCELSNIHWANRLRSEHHKYKHNWNYFRLASRFYYLIFVFALCVCFCTIDYSRLPVGMFASVSFRLLIHSWLRRKWTKSFVSKFQGKNHFILEYKLCSLLINWIFMWYISKLLCTIYLIETQPWKETKAKKALSRSDENATITTRII